MRGFGANGRIGRPRRWGWILAGLLVGTIWLAAPSGAGEDAEQTEMLEAALERVRVHPEDPEAFSELGHAYYEAGNLEDALEAFRAAVDLDPDHLEAIVNVGVVLNEMGMPSNALDMFRKALQVAPDDVLAICNEAISYYALGETEKAVRDLVRATEIDPRNQLAHFQLGIAFADAKIYKEAIREWEAVIAADSTTEAAAQAGANIRRLQAMLEGGK